MNRSSRVGASPMSAAATAAGHVVDRDAAVERHPVGDAELVGQRPELVLGIAAAVEVEADVEVGPLRGNARHGADRDVQLVRRGQGTGVDQPQRAIRAEGAARVGRRVEPRERRAVDDDRRPCRARRPSRSSRSRIASLTVSVARRERDRQPLLEEQQAGGSAGSPTRGKRRHEELRHRLVEVEDAAGRRRAAAAEPRTPGSPAASGPGRARTVAAVQPHGRPHRRGRRTRGTRAGSPEPGALMALDVEAADARRRRARPRPAGPGGAGRGRRPGARSRRAIRPRGGRAGPPRSRRGRSSGPAGRAAGPRRAVRARADQPAPRRRHLARRGSRRPRELSTVSTTRSASP